MIVPLTLEQGSAHHALASDLEYALLSARVIGRDQHDQQDCLLQRERSRIQRVLERGGWGVTSAAGVALVRPLPWDSSHFGTPCADLVRLYLSASASSPDAAALARAAVQEAQRRGIGLLSARLLAGQLAPLHALLADGFCWVDTSVELGATHRTLATLASGPADGEPAVHVRAGRAEDVARLQTIAATFTDNRFHRDARIAEPRARGVYTSWAATAVQQGRLLVAERNSEIAALATWSPPDDDLQVGVVGLVVVAPEHRGQGVFDPLVRQCIARAGGTATVTSTQLTNVTAQRAFGRLGLRPIAARHVLHGWLR